MDISINHIIIVTGALSPVLTDVLVDESGGVTVEVEGGVTVVVSGTGFSTNSSSNSGSLPILTVDVFPPFATLPGPHLDASAPSKTFTLRVTLPSFSAGTALSIHVTVWVFASYTPSSDALTNSTFTSSLSLIITSAAAFL